MRVKTPERTRVALTHRNNTQHKQRENQYDLHPEITRLIKMATIKSNLEERIFFLGGGREGEGSTCILGCEKNIESALV